MAGVDCGGGVPALLGGEASGLAERGVQVGAQLCGLGLQGGDAGGAADSPRIASRRQTSAFQAP